MKRLAMAMTVVVAAGCGVSVGEVRQSSPDVEGQARQEEAWASRDNPALFTADLEYRFASLPTSGAAQQSPWAGSYWPVYEDSINLKWDGENDAPSTKYGKAFNIADIENKVSKAHGIDAHATRTECTESSVCDSALGETCAKRAGAEKGRCIPTWWGICHAWAPVSMMLPEPKRPVTRNGVTFKVQDLKALATLVHDKTSSKFVSLRCNTQGGKDMALDAHGRVVANECRDTNAGTYHVLLANYLGLRKQSFVEDRTYDLQVWNQPLRAFRVKEHRVVDLAEANTLMGVTAVGGTTVTKAGTVKKSEWAHQGSFDVVAGQTVKVAMTGSGDADLYVRFGAEPTSADYACRPYDNGSNETCDLTVPEGTTQLFVSINGYADTSDFSAAITTGGSAPTSWVFNEQAASFVFIKSEVDYISESSSQTDGNLADRIDQYTHTDRYEYLLELDAEGKIVGGEWVGASKTAHPDFLWLPTGVRTTTVAGGAIRFDVVKEMILESVREEGGGTVVPQTKTESGAVVKGAWQHYGPFDAAIATQLKAVMTGTGDADLYVRRGSQPTATGYDCRPYKGGSAESCTVDGPGPVYVSVYGYAANSTFDVAITWTGAGAVTPPPPPTEFAHLDVSGDVAQGAWKVFELAVPAGKKLVVRTTAPNDVDLYLQKGAAPTASAYSQRAWTSSGAETLTFTATEAVTLHIGVHGYKASSFTVKTADE